MEQLLQMLAVDQFPYFKLSPATHIPLQNIWSNKVQTSFTFPTKGIELEWTHRISRRFYYLLRPFKAKLKLFRIGFFSQQFRHDRNAVTNGILSLSLMIQLFFARWWAFTDTKMKAEFGNVGNYSKIFCWLRTSFGKMMKPLTNAQTKRVHKWFFYQ